MADNTVTVKLTDQHGPYTFTDSHGYSHTYAYSNGTWEYTKRYGNGDPASTETIQGDSISITIETLSLDGFSPDQLRASLGASIYGGAKLDDIYNSRRIFDYYYRVASVTEGTLAEQQLTEENRTLYRIITGVIAYDFYNGKLKELEANSAPNSQELAAIRQYLEGEPSAYQTSRALVIN